MILTAIFACDNCKKEAFSYGLKLPSGWMGCRWTPGMISKPLDVERPAGRYHLCSPACTKAFFPEAAEVEHRSEPCTKP
jgi:hypothetical protein